MRSAVSPPPLLHLPGGLLVLRAVYVALTLLCAAGLVAAAVLVPAAPGALPAIIVPAVALPMIAAWELPSVVAAVRQRRATRRWRRQLNALPETRHPLGL